jgi:hypothetical protein
MNGSLQRIWLILTTLLRQNRLLLIGLVLWPFVLSLILFVAANGHPEVDDALSILHQELFYGLVLVGLGASTALGTEERTHRTQQVLGRGASRTEYLLALGLSAYLPFLGYLAAWLLNALVLAASLHSFPTGLPALLGCELLVGLMIGAAGLAWSVVLPQLAAAAADGLCLSLLLLAGGHDQAAWLSAFSCLSAGTTPAHGLAFSLALTIAASILLAVGGCVIFDRRDLRGL